MGARERSSTISPKLVVPVSPDELKLFSAFSASRHRLRSDILPLGPLTMRNYQTGPPRLTTTVRGTTNSLPSILARISSISTSHGI